MHRCHFRISYSDTDQGGIVHHASYLRYFEAARIEMLRDAGLSYRELEREHRLALAVAKFELKYVLPAFFDDNVIVETTVSEIRAATMTLGARMLRGDDVLTESSVVLVGFDLDQRRARRLPEFLTEKLKAC